MQNPITKAHADYTDYIIRYGVDEAARILDSYRYSVDPQIPHMDADNAAWERAYMEAASAIINAHQPTETENAPQAATQAAEGTDEKKEDKTMTGRIDRTHGINPAWEIQVDGYRAIRYMDYTKADAIRAYRRQHGLIGKHISWRDYTKPDMPQNLFDAYMAYLKA